MNNSARSAADLGFTYPFDNVTVEESVGCRYGCELNGQLCEWCTVNLPFFANRIHQGLDFTWSSVAGTPIRAMAGGGVITGNDGDGTGWGNWVKIYHKNGYATLYAHMQNNPIVTGGILQGTFLGTVGSTGDATGDHLHLELWDPNGIRIDPYPYVVDAEHYSITTIAPKNYQIFDGPLTLRAEPISSSTSYGTLSNGTIVSITKITPATDNFVFGYISSGTYAGKWIALGKTTGELYALNLTDQWWVFDGPLNVRETASSSAYSYGTITNGSMFNITEVYVGTDFIFGKISTSVTPQLANGSTCTTANAMGHWIAIDFCTTY